MFESLLLTKVGLFDFFTANICFLFEYILKCNLFLGWQSKKLTIIINVENILFHYYLMNIKFKRTAFI